MGERIGDWDGENGPCCECECVWLERVCLEDIEEVHG